MEPRGRPMRLNPGTTPLPVADLTTTTSVTSAQLQAMIDEGVTPVLAIRATTRNGDDSHTSGTGVRRNEHAVRDISNFTVACQVKFVTCTLQGNALTWWNSHVKTTTPEAAHAMPWRTLKKMMTDKYCPRGEIKETGDAIKFTTEPHGHKDQPLGQRQSDNKRKSDTPPEQPESQQTKDKTLEEACRRKCDRIYHTQA
ncbi:putative reverse transcriptase domain-containing protein [Tanacetum coccineum]|uniref:Reverse transcriptase domain-containing protein n=1 Tax=Tanacetum coccineum TaxID=301880 RepID=A0ABQ4X778_9ASTR